MNRGSNLSSESGTTRKITLILNALQGYLRHILSALKHPWQASCNIFQVSTLAPSTVSQAHHSALSSLLTWVLSLLPAPGADLLSPQPHRSQETVLRAGSLDGVKSLFSSSLSNQSWKVASGRENTSSWFSFRWCCLSDGKGSPAVARDGEDLQNCIFTLLEIQELQWQWSYRKILFSLSTTGTRQRQGEMMICGNSLISSPVLFPKTSPLERDKSQLQKALELPFVSPANRSSISCDFKGTLCRTERLVFISFGLRHHCKDADTHFQALRTRTSLHSPILPHLAPLPRYVHPVVPQLHLSWGPQFLPELWHRNTQVLPVLGWSWFTAWTLWFDLSRDSSPGLYLTVQIWPWMEGVIISPTLSSVLWDCSLVGEVTVPAGCMVTLSSQFIFPCGTALLLLAPDYQHSTFPIVILLLFTISTHKPKCKVSLHAFPKCVLQGLLYSHFLYLSKILSTPLYCTSYEMKRIAPFRRESCEEYKPCTPIANEDSTMLLQFPSCLKGDVQNCVVRQLTCSSWNHKTLLQIAKN